MLLGALTCPNSPFHCFLDEKPSISLLEASIQTISDLQNSYLVIQDPPDTVKTFTSSHAVLNLLRRGQRVAVPSNSHKAINNLLGKVERRANEVAFQFPRVKTASQGQPDSYSRNRGQVPGPGGNGSDCFHDHVRRYFGPTGLIISFQRPPAERCRKSGQVPCDTR